MKKYIYILVLILLGMNLTAQSVWNGKRESITKGSGTENDPYLIENAQNLAWLVYLINYDYSEWTEGKYFQLTTDIDLNGSADNQWIPISAGLSMKGKIKSFDATLDGNHHKITGLYIDNNSEINNEKSLWFSHEASFFNYLPETSKIINLYIEGSINIENKNCAGISASGGNLENCVANVDIESTESAAGIAEFVNSVKNCFNIGDIKGGNFVGGIVSYRPKNIENCYNVGNITGNDFVGGIAGGVFGSSHIKNCYNVGTINASETAEFIGGVAGNTTSENAIENCYYLSTCIENSNELGEVKTAEFMRSHEFVTLLNNGTNVWKYDEDNSNNGFPVLTHHFPIGVEQYSEEKYVVFIYPNPSTDYINISGDIVSYEIFDIWGKNVNSMEKVSGKIERVSVSDFTSGLYFVKCLLENGNVVTKKIIVK